MEKALVKIVGIKALKLSFFDIKALHKLEFSTIGMLKMLKTLG